MRFVELVARADAAYREGTNDVLIPLTDYIDGDGNLIPDPESGDTLGLFIVRELHSVFEENSGDEEQLATAADEMVKAIDDLDRVRQALIP